MKRTITILGGLALVLFAAFSAPMEDMKSLEIGATAPMTDVKMKDVSGKSISMEDMKQKNGLLVIFSCNTCPFVVGAEGYGTGWHGRYNELYHRAKKHGIGMIVVNSNEAKRGDEDSFDSMKKHAAEHKYEFPYVVDENHQVADAFGARTTPQVYLFDGSMKLVYKGAIDDNNEDASAVKEHWLNDALDNLANGKSIDPETTRNIGCSIKRLK